MLDPESRYWYFTLNKSIDPSHLYIVRKYLTITRSFFDIILPLTYCCSTWVSTDRVRGQVKQTGSSFIVTKIEKRIGLEVLPTICVSMSNTSLPKKRESQNYIKYFNYRRQDITRGFLASFQLPESLKRDGFIFTITCLYMG